MFYGLLTPCTLYTIHIYVLGLFLKNDIKNITHIVEYLKYKNIKEQKQITVNNSHKNWFHNFLKLKKPCASLPPLYVKCKLERAGNAMKSTIVQPVTFPAGCLP